MSPASPRTSRLNEERRQSAELLQVYGVLLTPRQNLMMQGFCMDGKSFSQIAREQGVSRQAIHEAVRGIQRLLKWYEEKLGLYGKRGSKQAASASPAEIKSKLTALEKEVKRRGEAVPADWLLLQLKGLRTAL